MKNGVTANELQTLDEILNELRSLGQVRGQQFRDEVLAYVQAN